MGVPLSTQKHIGSWYVDFKFQGKDVYAALSQAKAFSSARLYTRLGQIAENDIEKVRNGFRNLYLGE